MNKDYIITSDELTNEYGLNLNDLCINGTMDSMQLLKLILSLRSWINLEYLKLNDGFIYKEDIVKCVSARNKTVQPF